MYLRYFFCFASRRRHTRCALVTGVQTCALPFCGTVEGEVVRFADLDALKAAPDGSLAGKIAFVDYQMKRRRDGGDYRNAGGVRWGGPSAAIRKGAKAFTIRSAGNDKSRAPPTCTTAFEDGLEHIKYPPLSQTART